MAIKAPALPPTVRKGMNAAGDERGPTVHGTPMSDADVMSRMTAAMGRTTNGSPNPAPEEPAEAPEVPAVDPAAEAPEDDKIQIEDFNEGLPDSLKGTKPPESTEPEPETPRTDVEAGAEPEPETGPGEPEAKPKGKDLRSQLEYFSAQTKTLAKERDTLSSRVKELEAQVKDAPNSKTLNELLTTREQRIAELEKQISYLDYTQSDEFKQQYQTPYENKFTEAFKDLASLSKEDGSKLVQPELEELLLGGEREAYRFIEDKFTGSDAALAKRIVGDVYRLSRDKEGAMARAKTDAQKRTKTQEAERVRMREQYKAMFTDTVAKTRAKFPDLYQGDPKDKEMSQLMDTGYKLVDAAFNRMNEFAPEQRVVIESEIYHRAGAFPALRLRALRAEKALAIAKKELSKYRGSSPGKGEVSETETAGGKAPEIGSPEWAAKRLREAQSRVK